MDRINIRRQENTLYLLLSVTAFIIFMWSALHNGWMNDYYSAAAASGASGWKAFFFTSFDSASFVSVDKLPLSTWLSALSVMIFGVSPIAVALPHIAAGIVATLLVYNLVKRAASPWLGLLAAGLFLVTPIVSVIFGYNQPDSFFTLLLLASFYCFLRLIETKQHSFGWLAITALLLGLAFMTKSLEVLPLMAIYGIVYFYKYFYAQPTHRKQKTFSLLVAGGIFFFVALWWPLVVSLSPLANRPYIGSSSDNSPWSLLLGYNGLDRLSSSTQTTTQTTDLGSQFGGSPGVLRMLNSEFAPLIAWYLPLIIIGCVGIFLGNPSRYQKVLVGLSLAIVASYSLLFSFMHGVVHPYYVVILAPFGAIVAAFGMRWAIGWYHERQPRLRLVLPGILFVTSLFSAFILNYDGSFLSTLAPIVICLGMSATVILIWWREKLWSNKTLWLISIVIIGVGPVLQTGMSLSREHEGPYPSTYRTSLPTPKISEAAITFLRNHDRSSHRWIAVSESTALAAPVQLETSRPVMALGGFNGTDTIISLGQLQEYIEKNAVRYFVTSAHATEKTAVAWQLAHTAVYHDEVVTIYDLRNDQSEK